MASASFISENQSFSQSEANSSWASLIADQLQDTIEDEDYTDILDSHSDSADPNASVETHGRSRQHVDMRTFEQILQVMIQQGAALDRLRDELDQLRQERKQELEYRDARLRLSEKELHFLRAEKDKALVELEELEEELGALRASEEEEPASSDVLPLEVHNRIIRRVKDDARAQVENAAAERSHLTIQLSRLQIQVAQLKNQVEDRSYPDEVVEDLTRTLRDTVIETCKNADLEAQQAKQELIALRRQVASLERDLEMTRHDRENAENEAEEAKRNLEELHADHEAVQEQLAISESMQIQQNESALRESQEQVEQLQAELVETQKAREMALMDSEQLRTLLTEAEERRSSLASELKLTAGAFQNIQKQLADTESQLDELRKEHETNKSADLDLARKLDAETQKSSTLNAELVEIRQRLTERTDSLTAEVEQARTSLREAEESRAQTEARLKEVGETLASVTKERSDLEAQLKTVQDALDAASKRQSEEESEFQLAIQSKEAEMNEKTRELQEKINDLNQLLATAKAETAEESKLREKVEVERSRLVDETKKLEAELKLAKEHFANLEAEKEKKVVEAKGKQEQIEQLQTALAQTKKAQSEVLRENERLRLQHAEAESSRAEAKAKEEKIEQLQTALAQMRKAESEALRENERLRLQHAEAESSRAEVKAKEDQMEQLQAALTQMKKAESEALRENERLRLQHAEAESNRAEADLRNEELEQKISELEEEVKSVPLLESDLRNAQAQLAQALETMNQAKDEAAKYQVEISQSRAEIMELRAENEQLIAARRQMAAIYGLPAEPLSSPRNTPTRGVPSTPVRSSQSLSPSATSVAPHWLEQPAPPKKRRRTSKLVISGSNLGGSPTAPGSSPASAIFLDDMEMKLVAPPSTPTHREQLVTNGDIPKHLQQIFGTFAKLATWNDEDHQPVCGFCALHNYLNQGDRRPPLHFDPSRYPLTYWSHCLMRHKDALRPDVEVWVKEESVKLSTSEQHDLATILAKFTSWKRSETAAYVCGLCELEKRENGGHEPLNFDPWARPFEFWTHCQTEHVHFWKPFKG